MIDGQIQKVEVDVNGVLTYTVRVFTPSKPYHPSFISNDPVWDKEELENMAENGTEIEREDALKKLAELDEYMDSLSEYEEKMESIMSLGPLRKVSLEVL